MHLPSRPWRPAGVVTRLGALLALFWAGTDSPAFALPPQGSAPPVAAPLHSSAEWLPGPAPRPYSAEFAAAAMRTCARCHGAIYREWQSSRHAQAYTNRYFSRALPLEQVPFCRKCHAPDADPNREPDRASLQNGVSCLSCHAVRADFATVANLGSTSPPKAARPCIDSNPRLAGVDACRNCHQFDFPAASGSRAPTAMQNTAAEHAASRYAAVPCQGCHMQRLHDGNGRPHLDHRFVLGGHEGILKGAVTVRLVDWQPGRLKIALVPNMLGHAFPTGDLFRRAELRVWPGQEAAPSSRPAAVYALERRYRNDREGETRRVLFDTRLAPASPTQDARREVELTISPSYRRVTWQLVWQRLPVPLGELIGLDAHEHEVVIAEGQWSKPPR